MWKIDWCSGISHEDRKNHEDRKKIASRITTLLAAFKAVVTNMNLGSEGAKKLGGAIAQPEKGVIKSELRDVNSGSPFYGAPRATTGCTPQECHVYRPASFKTAHSARSAMSQWCNKHITPDGVTAAIASYL